MHTFKNIILALCIISFLNLCSIEKTSSTTHFLPRKQVNIAFVGFVNSGKSALLQMLIGNSYDFYGCGIPGIGIAALPPERTSLIVNDGKEQDYVVDCNLWDTSGHPSKKDEVIDSICKYMDIVVITVDLMPQRWRQDIISKLFIQWQNGILDVNPNSKIILACTKSDLISDPAQLRDIETAVSNIASVQGALGENIKGVILSAQTGHNLDTLVQIIKDDLREIGLDNLRDIHEELPCESSGGCLLL